ncbi:hypothetical protein L7F22_025164 [Adiantum nelumboides]|nr:hypothetical protein [Adiantum nelumboides]
MMMWQLYGSDDDVADLTLAATLQFLRWLIFSLQLTLNCFSVISFSVISFSVISFSVIGFWGSAFQALPCVIEGDYNVFKRGKWHPDKHNGEEFAKARFQEINEAYRVLIDPAKRRDYDLSVELPLTEYSAAEYLDRFRGLILTCNGLDALS